MIDRQSGFCLPRAIAAVLLCLVSGLPGAGALAQDRVPATAGEIRLTFAPVVATTAPAVVNVYTTTEIVERRSSNPLLDDPFFQRFFGREFGPPLERRRERSSQGSGVIVRPDGLVVTNHHVVAGAETARVVLADGREFTADILLSDERTDLALMRIEDAEAEALPTIPLGDSETLAVGDLVLAIGNPFGVGQTVTMGIVSAVARPARGVADFDYFIQTDAAINPGNSGGALVTIEGELIGINTAIYSRDGGSLGIGFAIPVNMVRAVLASVDRGQPLIRPWLGAGTQPLTADLAAALGIDRPRGALVTSISPASPAEAAGLAPGDVIVRFDGTPVEGPSALDYRLAIAVPGDTVPIEIVRQGEATVRDLLIALPPEDPPRDTRRLEGRHPFAGALIANLSPALIEEIGFPHGYETGVVVLDVAARSPAAQIGLQTFDRIVALNGTPVADTQGLARLVDRTPPPWRVVVMRGERRLESVFAR